jgi:NADH-quinone oxidoreductase subunit L
MRPGIHLTRALVFLDTKRGSTGGRWPGGPHRRYVLAAAPVQNGLARSYALTMLIGVVVSSVPCG